MQKNSIAKIEVLRDSCLGVFPEKKDGYYQHVYREAAGVHWDSELGCFKSTPPKEWSYGKWYQQILSVAVSGVGVMLQLTPETKIESEKEGFSEIIRKADMEMHR